MRTRLKSIEIDSPVRRPLSKRVRFSVFKRDGFTCQYCGSTPPAAVLEVDHVLPVAKGGSDDLDNLITACFDCNRGKRDELLNQVLPSLAERAEVLRERREQTRAYEKLLLSIRRDEDRVIDQVQDIFWSRFPEYGFSTTFRESVRRFVQLLPACIIKDAMELSCVRMPEADRAIRYFCGICWRDIKRTRP